LGTSRHILIGIPASFFTIGHKTLQYFTHRFAKIDS
jgi:hypothetical protein